MNSAIEVFILARQNFVPEKRFRVGERLQTGTDILMKPYRTASSFICCYQISGLFAKLLQTGNLRSIFGTVFYLIENSNAFRATPNRHFLETS